MKKNARKVRKITELVGKRVRVPESLLLTPAMRQKMGHRFAEQTCKVVKVKADKNGMLSAIYVVRPAVRKYNPKTNRFEIKKWQKTPKRLLAETFVRPIRRYRWEDESDFRWKVANQDKPGRCSPSYVGIARSTKQWHEYPTIGYWLNNPDALEQVVLRRYDEQRYGPTQFSDNPDSSNFKPKKHWRQWNKQV